MLLRWRCRETMDHGKERLSCTGLGSRSVSMCVRQRTLEGALTCHRVVLR